MTGLEKLKNVNDQAYQRTSVPAREEKFTIQHTPPLRQETPRSKAKVCPE